MAHGMVKGVDKLVSGRKKSVWHQSETDTVFADNLMDPEEAWKLGFGWEPTLIPARISVDDKNTMVVPEAFIVCRDDRPTDDPARVLGVVGKRYTTILNHDLCDFAHALTAKGNARIDTAGSIDGGRRVYVTAVLAGEQQIIDDKIAQWLLITSTHDGTACQEAMMVPLRVVCQNTLSCGMSSGTNRIKVRHTKNADERLMEAAKVFSMANEYFAAHADAMRTLAQCRMTRKAAEDFLLNTILPGAKTKAKNDRETILDLFDGGQMGGDLVAVKGTMYGLVNAWEQFAETDKTVRRQSTYYEKGENEARFDSVLFGQTARVRDDLINAAIEFAQ
jgi:phage/plasmid-like protein (TIGR03299 family)